MLHDFHRDGAPEEPRHDLCIVGAGAAGIALALEFLGTGHRVALLESGGLEPEAETQDLYDGEVVGLDYAGLAAVRLRYFGGTTNHWAGYVLPFPDHSFEPLDWIPHSGWPVRGPELREHYRRAFLRLGLEAADWDPAQGWSFDRLRGRDRPGRLPLEGFRDVHTVINPVRMGEAFRAALAAAPNVDVFLHANLAAIRTDGAARHVEGLEVRSLGGRSALFRARHYVLAAGGIENARLLLASDSVQAEGLGNGRGLVGRFFSDHVHFRGGFLAPADAGLDLRDYERRIHPGGIETLVWKELTFETMRAERLALAGLELDRIGMETAGGATLRRVLREASIGRMPADPLGDLRRVLGDLGEIAGHTAAYLWHGHGPARQIDLEFLLEPVPNPESRVTLGEERDALGMRRVRLDWRLTELDARTMRFVVERFAAQMAAAGRGRVHLDFDWPDFPGVARWAHHNIGTTRMADDPADGVVDRHCRVHGIDNLHVAGSSVFPTCGGGSPTPLVIALAIRLADHLKERGFA